ncbi:thioredoxin domain-containing protein [Aurantivibrio infirmus]
MTIIKNTLGATTSLYLLQHKDNPVAWQQWTDEVLELADQQDKPILLSIGYSACHWCHVMAKESFEDEETAELMNEKFINIKVDREERPDIDLVYQTSHLFLTGLPGGWPLTAFLCPRTKLPFLIGTYFPKQNTQGRMSFKELLLKVNDYYQTRGKDFVSVLDQVRESFESLAEQESADHSDTLLNEIPIERAAIDLLNDADLQSGGFGRAPKFAMATSLERLFVTQLHKNELTQGARNHFERSLLMMCRSGINDQIGGGFFRYSTDDEWMIPHYEKMLYDNGLLLAIYSQAWSIFSYSDFERCARGIARWALEEMRSSNGAFYGSLNADADNRQGGFYTWDVEELNELLSAKENGVVRAVYELDKVPNFENLWHLHRERDWGSIIEELELDETNVNELLESAHEKMRQARTSRIKPIRDNKILTAWNGLMIRGLAVAGRIFQDDSYRKAAQQAVDFIRNNLWLNQRLYATWQNDKAKYTAYLDDYVFLMDGLSELLRIEWRDEDYRFLCGLAESLIENFEDKENGGFYFSAHDHEELAYRGKPFSDGVLPAGNGVAAKIFGRMGHLCAEPRYLDCAKRTLLSGWASMLNQPKNHHNALLGLAEFLSAPVQVMLKGGEQMREWRQTIQIQYGELVHCYWVPLDSDIHPPELFLLEDEQGLVCVGDECLEPQDDLAALLEQLSEVVV